jgi:hypothetical protein
VIAVPVAVAVGGPFPNPAKTNKKILEQLDDAVAELEFADLFRGPGTIAEAGIVRIDVQGPLKAGNGNNIQAQVGNAGTIAAILIAHSLGAAQGVVNQNTVLEAAQNAIIASGNDGNWCTLTGTEP